MKTTNWNSVAKTPVDIYANYRKKIFLPLSKLKDWDFYSLIHLIVSEYHCKLRHRMSTIYDLANEVFVKSNGQHPELAKLVETLFLFFDDLLFQFKKEEQILFPNIIQLAEKKLHEGSFSYSTFGIITEHANMMKTAHRYALNQLKIFRRLTNNYKPTKGMYDSHKRLVENMKLFEQELLMHIHLEKDILIPKAIQIEQN